MLPMLSKVKQNEDGITLIELLAAVTIAAIIGMIGISILLTGYKTQNRIETEAELRDEADLIMASMLNELYTLKVSEINNTRLPETGTSNYYLEIIEKEDGSKSKIGFINGKVIINNQEITLGNDNIELMKESKISELNSNMPNEVGSNLNDNPIEIILALRNTDSGQQIETRSVIRVINDNNIRQ